MGIDEDMADGKNENTHISRRNGYVMLYEYLGTHRWCV